MAGAEDDAPDQALAEPVRPEVGIAGMLGVQVPAVRVMQVCLFNGIVAGGGGDVLLDSGVLVL